MILSVNEMNFQYHSVPVLRDVTFALPRGKCSGCSASTARASPRF